MRSKETDRDIKVKMTLHFTTTNQTSHSGDIVGKSGQTIGRLNKIDFRLYHSGNIGQLSNNPSIRVNTTIVIMNKKSSKYLS